MAAVTLRGRRDECVRGLACLLGSGVVLVPDGRLCVSDGLHIGGWSGVNGAGIGLFARVRFGVVPDGWLCVSGGWHFGSWRDGCVQGLACLLGSGLCLVSLWWLCVSGSWHFGRCGWWRGRGRAGRNRGDERPVAF